jgi:pyridoxal phosphate enzyme (YggS family)
VSIADNIKRLRERVEICAQTSGRNPADIEIMAVSKNHPAESIISAIEAGIRHIGENRIQEAEAKFRQLTELNPNIKFTRHFVGHLQTNKAGKALLLFDIIQSVDSLHLAETLSKACVNSIRTVNILIQVNTSGEASKYGVKPNEALSLVESISAMPTIQLKGLMTIGAFTDDAKAIRKCFLTLRKLSEKIASYKFPNAQMKFLSMGMTSDFEIAIAEGANLLRIGTAIFGER